MSDQESSIDRRKKVLLREAISPILTAVIVGIGSSFLTTYVAVNNLQLKVTYIEKNMDTLTQLIKDLNQSSLRIERIEMWQGSQITRMDKLETRVDRIGETK